MSNKPGEEQLALPLWAYQALGPGQTRLLRVHPSRNLESGIVCDLFAVTLGKKCGATPVDDDLKNSSYDALSYAWGKPNPTERILLNGHDFYVSENLHDALRHVEMMFDIYLKASTVVVWLGHPTSQTGRVFDLVDKINDLGLYERRQAVRDPDSRRGAHKLIETTPWFKRTWVRQEVHAARQVRLVCGGHQCAFDDFAAVMDDLLPDMQSPQDAFRPARDPGRDVSYRARLLYLFFKRDCDTRHFPEAGAGMHDFWFRLIMRSSLYEATLPQDRVYAVLGIVSNMTRRGSDSQHLNRVDSVQGFPEVDYTKSVFVVYQDFVKHAVNVSGNLSCLSVFQDRDETSLDLHSWVVDLRRNVPRFLIPLEMFSFDNPGDRNRLPEQDYSEDGVLRLWGRLVGTVGAGATSWGEEGARRDVAGSLKTGGLESCLPTNDRWLAKEGSKGAEETFRILRKRCRYVWRGAHPAPGRIEGEVLEDWRFDGDKGHVCHAFVSHLAGEGDLTVSLAGATVPFVLRPWPDEDDRYIFLGPAVLTCGYVKLLKDSRETFHYSTARCCDLRGEPGEMFVLL